MRRFFTVVALAVVLVLMFGVSASALTPANGGMGKLYGEHISSEAKAGMLGPDVHPGMHRGMSGWMMPMP